MKKTNKDGTKIGLLTIVKEIEKKGRDRVFLCKCNCGKTREARASNIFRKDVSKNLSCGCWKKRKKYAVQSFAHYRRLYHVWLQMIKRCSNQSSLSYHNYGGRGILVSKEWTDFANFYNDMIDSYSPGLTIERIDVNGNYCKENCTWIPNEAQAKNRRTTIWVNGMCAKDACKTIGLNYATFQQRLKSGKTVAEAFY